MVPNREKPPVTYSTSYPNCYWFRVGTLDMHQEMLENIRGKSVKELVQNVTPLYARPNYVELANEA